MGNEKVRRGMKGEHQHNKRFPKPSSTTFIIVLYDVIASLVIFKSTA
jgi:hypothetical protein